MPGRLAGRRHQARSVTLVVERTSTGGMLVRSPKLPGWARAARTPIQVAEAVAAAFTEAEVAAYARFRGTVYDVAEVADQVPTQALTAARRHPAEPAPQVVGHGKAATQRPDVHPLDRWQPLEDGRWLSPDGRRFGAGTSMVASIIAKRTEAGLPVSA